MTIDTPKIRKLIDGFTNNLIKLVERSIRDAVNEALAANRPARGKPGPKPGAKRRGRPPKAETEAVKAKPGRKPKAEAKAKAPKTETTSKRGRKRFDPAVMKKSVEEALAKTNGNVSKAADLLGVTRPTVVKYRDMKLRAKPGPKPKVKAETAAEKPASIAEAVASVSPNPNGMTATPVPAATLTVV